MLILHHQKCIILNYLNALKKAGSRKLAGREFVWFVSVCFVEKGGGLLKNFF